MKKLILTVLFLTLLCSLACLTACGGIFDDLFGGFDEDEYQKSLERTITVVANDPSLGTVSGGGVYKRGDSIVLTATANEGCKFVGWADGVDDARRVESVTENCTYTANFERIPEPKYISSVSVASMFTWGQTELFKEGQMATIWYDNGEKVSVPVSELQIEGISTEQVGYFDMTVAYNGFTKKTSYRVVYGEMDVSGLNVKETYLLNEQLSATGHIVVRGENGKSQQLTINDERVTVTNFDTSKVTHDAEKGQICTKDVFVTVNHYVGQSVSYKYSVWYAPANKVFAATLDQGEYQLSVEKFAFSADNTFQLLIKKIKPGNVNLTEDVYEEENFRRMTWTQDPNHAERINLYYKKNALAKEQHIGYFNAKTNSLMIFKEVFDDGILKIEFAEDLHFFFYDD